MLDLREKARRQDALDKLERLCKQVSSRNQDLSDEEAESIADQLSREAVANLIQKSSSPVHPVPG